MLPSVKDVLAGYPFFAQRFGIDIPADESAVRAALDTARTLAAGHNALEPAALFFAFATYRRAFPGAGRRMAQLLARAHAHRQGVRIDADSLAFDALYSDVMHKRVGFDAVRIWFEELFVTDL